MACDHNVKLFAYDQLKVTSEVKIYELKLLRKALSDELKADTIEAQQARSQRRREQHKFNKERHEKKMNLLNELGGWNEAIEAELEDLGYPRISPEEEILAEEEYVMSYMLIQIEMESSLESDYDSIIEASKSMTIDLQNGIKEFDHTEKRVSWAMIWTFHFNQNIN